MFGIGFPEMVVLALVGLVVLGPDRLPGLARDAARMIHTLREMATGAREQLREELGPEFADVDLRSLNPRTAITRAVLGEEFDLDKYDPRRFDARAAARDLFTGSDGADRDGTGHDGADRAAQADADLDAGDPVKPVSFDKRGDSARRNGAGHGSANGNGSADGSADDGGMRADGGVRPAARPRPRPGPGRPAGVSTNGAVPGPDPASAGFHDAT